MITQRKTIQSRLWVLPVEIVSMQVATWQLPDDLGPYWCLNNNDGLYLSNPRRPKTMIQALKTTFIPWKQDYIAIIKTSKVI